MTLRESVYLLPSYELDGYPRSLPAGPARDLLSGWVALWHPRLIAATQSPPRWQQASQLPNELSGLLLILPSISEEPLESEAETKIAAAGGVLVRPCSPWPDFQQQLLTSLEAAKLLIAPEGDTPLVEELLQDFAALGYAFLQIQLMTRQLRYTSNLDLLQFGHQLSEAATATLAGDRETAEQMLQACFDSLGQERDHYYSLDVNLIDVTLLATTTLGQSLTAQLEDTQVTTLMASGSLLCQLKEKHPETHRQLMEALAQRQTTLAGGLDVERPHPLMTRDSIARDFARGRKVYEELEQPTPRVFSRASFGFAPDTPALLKRWGFTGCFLTAWSGGSYPEGSQAKISWEAADGTFLPALALSVLDASDPASFLSLGWSIGEALDHQHVPTVVFAHWPNRSCEFAQLLRHVARRTPALGRWMLADDYFDETDQPYHQERLAASGFRYNWLLQAGDSASQLVHATKVFHALQARCRSLQNLFNLAWQLERYHRLSRRAAASSSTPNSAAESSPGEAGLRPMEFAEWAPELNRLMDLADSTLDDPKRFLEMETAGHSLADALSEQVLERLAKQMHKPNSSKTASDKHVGRLLMNPRSCPMRVQSHTDAKQHFAHEADWLHAEGRVGDERVTCVDIPSLGFVLAPLQTETHPSVTKERPLADAGGMLNNEFLEVQVDTARGNLRSLHIPARRGNRLSLMIARRDVTDAGKYVYSNMVASEVRMLTSSNVCGLIRACGHLELNNQSVAAFEIDYRLWRGSRVVEISLRLQELASLASNNPWRSAYIARLAWPTEAAILRSFACGSRHQWSGGRALAPGLIEIDETDYRTHYLTGGLAFHRRVEERFLETILAVQGDATVHHRFGIGVDLPHPLLASTQFLDRPYELELTSHAPATASSGWLASVDTKNVIVDLECPLVDAAGELVGVRLFLTETDGKSTNARVRLLRELESANRVDYIGGTIGKLTAEGDQITIAMRASEQVNVDVIWKK